MSDDIYEIEEVAPGMSCQCVSNYSCDHWVAIPSAQHEALMALREPLQAMLDWADTPSNEASPSWIAGACHRAKRALVALRAALEAAPGGKEE